MQYKWETAKRAAGGWEVNGHVLVEANSQREAIQKVEDQLPAGDRIVRLLSVE